MLQQVGHFDRRARGFAAFFGHALVAPGRRCRWSARRWRSGTPVSSCTSSDAARGFVGDDFEVIGVAAHHRAERDQRVELAGLRHFLQHQRHAPARRARSTSCTSSVATPSLASSLAQADSRPSQMSSLKRLMTMPIAQALRPGRSGRVRRCLSVVPMYAFLQDQAFSRIAGDFQPEAGHARHLARAGQQPHLADAEVAQDLRADAVDARVPLAAAGRSASRLSAAQQVVGGLRRDAAARSRRCLRSAMRSHAPDRP